MNNRHYLLDYIEEAIKDKDLDTVKFTLEKIRTKGIQISNSNTPLLYLAVEQQAENIFFYLLEQLNNQEKKTSLEHAFLGMNIFHHAAVFGNAEIFNALMVLYYEVIPATRVNTNLPWHHTNYQQNQALHLACIHGHLEIVRLIVENPTTEIKKEQEKEKGKEKEDLYPSHSAIAALNAVDDEGNTPFHLAITHQHGEIAEYLINRGAVTLNQNIKGSTPFQEVNLDFALNDLATIPLEKRIKFFEEVIFFKKNAEQLEELKKIHLQLVSRFRLTDLLVLLFRNGIFNMSEEQKNKQAPQDILELIWPGSTAPSSAKKNETNNIQEKSLALTQPSQMTLSPLLALRRQNGLLNLLLDPILGAYSSLYDVNDYVVDDNNCFFDDFAMINELIEEIRNHINNLQSRKNKFSFSHCFYDLQAVASCIGIYSLISTWLIFLTTNEQEKISSQIDDCRNQMALHYNATYNLLPTNSQQNISSQCDEINYMVFYTVLFGIFGFFSFVLCSLFFLLRDKSINIYRGEWENLQYNLDLMLKSIRYFVEHTQDQNQIQPKLIDSLQNFSSYLHAESIHLSSLVQLLNELISELELLKKEICHIQKPIISLFFKPAPTQQRAFLSELNEYGEGEKEIETNNPGNANRTYDLEAGKSENEKYRNDIELDTFPLLRN